MKKLLCITFAVAVIFALSVISFAVSPSPLSAIVSDEIGLEEVLTDGDFATIYVCLNDNIEIEGTITVPKDKYIQIDFNGNSITKVGEGTAFQIENNTAFVLIDGTESGECTLSAESGAAIENFGTVTQNGVNVCSEYGYAVKNHKDYELKGGNINNGDDAQCAIVWNIGSFYLDGGSVCRKAEDDRILFYVEEGKESDAQFELINGEAIGNFTDNENLNIKVEGNVSIRIPNENSNPNISDDALENCVCVIDGWSDEYGEYRTYFTDFQVALDTAVNNRIGVIYLLKTPKDIKYYINAPTEGLIIVGFDLDNRKPRIVAGEDIEIENDVWADGEETICLEIKACYCYGAIRYFPNGGKNIYGDEGESAVIIDRHFWEEPGDKIDVIATPFYREGYVFLGWSADSEATKAEFVYRNFANRITIGEVTELYAVWKEADENDVVFSLSSDEGRKGESITLDVNVDRELSLGAISMNILYDHNVLKLVGYEGVGIESWVVGLFNPNNAEGASCYCCPENKVSGTILRLRFRVLENDIGEIPVVITDLNVADFDENPVSCVFVPGTVNIRRNFIYGDVNANKFLEANDILRLAKYLANMNVEIDIDASDVNIDGCIGSADLIRLVKYHAGVEGAKLGTDDRMEEMLTVQIGGEPETLDPTFITSVDGGNMIMTLFEPLLIIDENENVVPGQAESYEVSDDGLTWTFTMRDGLKWSDGTPLDAKDFEFSIKRLADPYLNSYYADTLLAMVEGYDMVKEKCYEEENYLDYLGVNAGDDGKTLTIRLSYPCAYFDRIVAFANLCPVNSDVMEKCGDEWTRYPETYICNGPYKMVDWIPEEYIIVEKNEYYKGGWDSERIVTEKIKFLLIFDEENVAEAYNNGVAQLVKGISVDEAKKHKSSEKGGDLYIDDIIGTYYIEINYNNENEALKDKNVRKAISLAIDREYIANEIMDGFYSPAYNLVGPGFTEVDAEGKTFSFYEKAIALNRGTYISKDYAANLAAAKAALKEAGYDEKNRLTINYTVNKAGYHLAIAQYMKDVLGEIGIDLEIADVEWPDFMNLLREGSFDLLRNGWVADYADASNILVNFRTEYENNNGKYSNSAYDSAIRYSETEDIAEHYGKLHEAEKLLMENYACIPLVYYSDFWLWDSSLKGVYHTHCGYWYLQYAYIEK